MRLKQRIIQIAVSSDDPTKVGQLFALTDTGDVYFRDTDHDLADNEVDWKEIPAIWLGSDD